MSEKIPVLDASGWVIRTSNVIDSDKQFVEFVVAATANQKRDWLLVKTAYQRVPPDEWQHIAVCRSTSEVRLYWNGKLSARQTLAGIELHSSPTNMFLGVRRDAYPGREFIGDIRAFRMISAVHYDDTFTPAMAFGKHDRTIVALDFLNASEKQVPDSSGNQRRGIVVGAKLIAPKK